MDAVLVAVAKHGAEVGMDEIAAEAGTSKTVVYRYFADRAGLYDAVSARVAADLLPRLARAVQPNMHPRAMVAAAIETYLAFVEADPQVYRFVVHGAFQARNSSAQDLNPIRGLSDVVSNQVTVIIAEALEQEGRDPAAAAPWGHGVVGLVRAAADWWLLAERPAPRADLATQLTDLAWSGLSGVVPTLLRNQGTEGS